MYAVRTVVADKGSRVSLIKLGRLGKELLEKGGVI